MLDPSAFARRVFKVLLPRRYHWLFVQMPRLSDQERAVLEKIAAHFVAGLMR